MIEARHTLTGKWLANFCSGRYMDRYFRRVNISGDGGTAGHVPLLMLANHFSWWDGFIQYRLNKRVWGRRLHVMMLEEQLRRHMIMNRCGCFSIRKNSRSILETMQYTLKIMKDEGNMVLMFPQGEISSMHCPDVEFQSGVGYLLKNIENDYRIVFNVNLTDYGAFKKPELNVLYKVVDPRSFEAAGDLHDAYNLFYRECLSAQIKT